MSPRSDQRKAAILLEERGAMMAWLEAHHLTVTDSGFGMGQADLVYERMEDQVRISVTLSVESDG